MQLQFHRSFVCKKSNKKCSTYHVLFFPCLLEKTQWKQRAQMPWESLSCCYPYNTISATQESTLCESDFSYFQEQHFSFALLV